MPETWIAGDQPRLSIAVTDINGVAADPGGLRLLIKPPSGAVVTHVYGAGDTIVRDSVGAYHADITMAAAGRWSYRWESDAPARCVGEDTVVVQKSRVV